MFIYHTGPRSFRMQFFFFTEAHFLMVQELKIFDRIPMMRLECIGPRYVGATESLGQSISRIACSRDRACVKTDGANQHMFRFSLRKMPLFWAGYIGSHLHNEYSATSQRMSQLANIHLRAENFLCGRSFCSRCEGPETNKADFWTDC